ncbi:MAG: tetratricopeptide repeat protein [Deltaproteobacteria bacterium]|nr:tetratricopeptide repeat protein [Deltaproteobacteria bacterium]
MTRYAPHLLCFLFLAGPLSGCVTLTRHNVLKARVTAMEREKAELETEQERDRERMKRLHKDLVEATEALRKGGANLGADIDTVKADVARLQGTDEETSYQLSRILEDLEMIKKALDEKLGLSLIKLPKGVTDKPDSLQKAGKKAMGKGDYRTARGLFQRILDSHPDHSLASQAQFLIGETYFKEGKQQQAIREYQRVHDSFRDVKSAPVEMALARIAEILLAQGDCEKARSVLKYLIEYDRKSPEAKAARDRLKKLGRKCKGR